MKQFAISIPALAVAAALSLAACDQKSNTAMNKPADTPSAKIAATTDKVATAVPEQPGRPAVSA